VLHEACEAVLAHRLQQPVARLALLLAHVHEGLLHEAAEQRERVARSRPVGAHRLDGLERERTAEHAQLGQQRPLGGSEQVIAPVEQRAQRAVAWHGGAAPAREHREHVVQPRGELLDAERGHLRGGQLEGERQAVEPRAHGRDRRGRAGGEREPGCTACARSTNSCTAS
jgi:hypothetical protein